MEVTVCPRCGIKRLPPQRRFCRVCDPPRCVCCGTRLHPATAINYCDPCNEGTCQHRARPKSGAAWPGIVGP